MPRDRPSCGAALDREKRPGLFRGFRGAPAEPSGEQMVHVRRGGAALQRVSASCTRSAAYLDYGFLQLKVMELLMLLGRIPRDNSSEPYRSAKQAELIRHLRDHLLDGQGRLCVALTAGGRAQYIGIASAEALQAGLRRAGVPLRQGIPAGAGRGGARTQRRNVTQIAQNAGYDNASKFSECFKKRYGVTPTQYRARAKNASKRDS